MKKLYITIAVVALLCGCATLFTGVITITSVVDAAMTDWAELSARHQTTPEFDAKVIAAHDKYRAAAAIAQAALISYKLGGPDADYLKALQVLRDATTPLIDLISSIVAPKEGVKLKTSLLKATQP